MSDSEKVLTYEEAKEMCKKAFNAGADYGSLSMRYNCNAVAHDWEHWLKKNEGLFRTKPTVKEVLQELVVDWDCALDCEDKADVLKDYAAKFRLVDDGREQ